MYKVSVVIPIYKVEDYIVRCAESLFNQTLDDIQFIFVDDASPDNSVALLEQTLERFPQRRSHTIILHHPVNLGVPSARATGLARVEAPYVAYCDSDDYVEPDMYARLYENAVQNDSDMVICGRKKHCVDGRTINLYERPNPTCSLILNFLYGRLRPAVWCRLTKTDLYRRVKFPKENYLEDWVQTPQLLTYAKRVSFLDEPLYHYDQNHPLSITNDNNPQFLEIKRKHGLENYRLMHDFIMEHHRVKEKDFIVKKMTICNSFYLSSVKHWNVRKEYLMVFPEINFSFVFNWSLPLKYKAEYLLILVGLYPIAKKTYDFIRKKMIHP